MTDVFLSYKAEDRSRIARLVEALEEDGLSVWWDAHLGAGDQWREAILRHLESAKCVIVVWSRRSVGPDGEFVRDEATRAKRRGTYLPVRIDKVDPPLGFGETQALDLSGWKSGRSDPRYHALMKTLRDRLEIKGMVERPLAGPLLSVSRRTVVATLAVTSGIAASAWFWVRPSKAHSDSIAVLPFANLSGDPEQAYFSDGVAEELRSSLSRLAGLKVVGRTSSEAVRDKDAKSAAKQLGVSNILTGSVRQSPSTIRISAQLIDGGNGMERWSANYDRAPGDVIRIQTDIAEKVSHALAGALGVAARSAITLGGTQNALAQKLILQAVPQIKAKRREDVAVAIERIDQAIALDSSYADAHIYKALALSWYGNVFGNAEEVGVYRNRALQSATLALRLAPNLGTAHHALAEIHRGNLDLQSADREYRRALKLAPGNARILRDYADFASKVGRRSEALTLSAEALLLDPLDPLSYRARFGVLMGNRSFQEAIKFSKDVQQNDPRMFRWPVELSFALLALNQNEEARRVIHTLPAADPDRLIGDAILQARGDHPAEAQKNIDDIARTFGKAASYQFAEVYAQMADKDRAIAALEDAWEVRDSGLLWLRFDPMLDPLRNDAGFQSILARLNFPK